MNPIVWVAGRGLERLSDLPQAAQWKGWALSLCILTPEAVLSSGGSLGVKREGGRCLDSCGVDPPPCWEALGKRVGNVE